MDRISAHLFADIIENAPENRLPWREAFSATLFCAPYECNREMAVTSLRPLSIHRFHASKPCNQKETLLQHVIEVRLGHGQAWKNQSSTVARAIANNRVHMCHFFQHWGLSLEWLRKECTIFFGTNNVPGQPEYTPLQTAAFHAALDVCKFFKESSWFNLQDVRAQNCLALKLAAQSGDAPTYAFIQNWRDKSGHEVDKSSTVSGLTKEEIIQAATASLDKVVAGHCVKKIIQAAAGSSSEVVECGSLEILKLFKQVGMTLDDKTTMTTSIVALEHGHLSIFRFLQSWSSSLTSVAFSKKTLLSILHAAAKGGHLDILQFLAKDCALNIKHIRSQNNRALREACINGHLHILQFLKRTWPLTAQDARVDLAPFCRAAEFGHVHVLQFLMDWERDDGLHPGQKINLSTMRAHDNAALCKAAENGHLKVLMFLKKCGLTTSDVRARNNHALRMSTTNGHLHVLKFLKDWLEDEETVDDIRALMSDPFRDAGGAGNVRLLKFLKQWLDESGMTLADHAHVVNITLISAVCGNHLAVCKLLKQWVIAPPQRISETLDIPIKNGNLEMFRFLLDWGAIPGSNELHLAVSESNMTMVKLLKQSGHISKADVSGRIVSTAAKQENFKMCRFLCDWALES